MAAAGETKNFFFELATAIAKQAAAIDSLSSELKAIRELHAQGNELLEDMKADLAFLADYADDEDDESEETPRGEVPEGDVAEATDLLEKFNQATQPPPAPPARGPLREVPSPSPEQKSSGGS